MLSMASVLQVAEIPLGGSVPERMEINPILG